MFTEAEGLLAAQGYENHRRGADVTDEQLQAAIEVMPVVAKILSEMGPGARPLSVECQNWGMDAKGYMEARISSRKPAAPAQSRGLGED